MAIFDTIKDRRSIRTYKGECISKDKLEKLLEAARLAPSAGNGQHWKFIVVENEQIKNQLVTASNNQAFVGTASHVIAGIGEPAKKWHQVDLAIALEHIAPGSCRTRIGHLLDWRFQRRRSQQNTQDTARQKNRRFTDCGDPS